MENVVKKIRAIWDKQGFELPEWIIQGEGQVEKLTERHLKEMEDYPLLAYCILENAEPESLLEFIKNWKAEFSPDGKVYPALKKYLRKFRNADEIKNNYDLLEYLQYLEIPDFDISLVELEAAASLFEDNKWQGPSIFPLIQYRIHNYNYLEFLMKIDRFVYVQMTDVLEEALDSLTVSNFTDVFQQAAKHHVDILRKKDSEYSYSGEIEGARQCRFKDFETAADKLHLAEDEFLYYAAFVPEMIDSYYTEVGEYYRIFKDGERYKVESPFHELEKNYNVVA